MKRIAFLFVVVMAVAALGGSVLAQTTETPSTGERHPGTEIRKDDTTATPGAKKGMTSKKQHKKTADMKEMKKHKHTAPKEKANAQPPRADTTSKK